MQFIIRILRTIATFLCGGKPQTTVVKIETPPTPHCKPVVTHVSAKEDRPKAISYQAPATREVQFQAIPAVTPVATRELNRDQRRKKRRSSPTTL